MSLFHLGKYKSMLGLIIAFALVALAGQVMQVIWTFFTKEMYGWEVTAVGISLSVVGLLVGLVQAVLVGILVKRFGNKKVIKAGFIFWTIGMFSFCVAFNEPLLYIALLPYILGGMAQPTVQGMLSNSVSASEQGNLQGALTQLISLAAIISPFIFGGLFYTFSSADAPVYFPAAPFLAGGIIMAIAAVIAFISLKGFKEPEKEPVLAPAIDTNEKTEVI